MPQKIPQSLQPLLSVSVPALAPPVAGAGPSSGSIAGYSIQHQSYSNWCWAAVTASVANCFNPPGTLSQCSVAANQLGLNCCGGDGPGPCNRTWNLDQPLQQVGNYDHRDDSTVLFSDLQTEVSGQRPVGCRIVWSDQSAHFVTVIGWSTANGSDWVDVGDPAAGFVQLSYSDLVSAYDSQGTWTNTYITRSSAGAPAGGAAASSASYPVAP
jgi:Papain-like cysteine protease AvrRpt2